MGDTATVPATTTVTPRAADLYPRIGNLYRQAYGDNMSLSAYLERIDPEHEYKDGLDAFSRQLKVAGIRVNSDYALGYYADRWEDFNEDEQKRALVPEWMHRVYRKTAMGFDPFAAKPTPLDRDAFISNQFPLNSIMRPYADAAAARMQQLAPAIPLEQLVAINTPIEGDAYRSFYLTEPADNDKRFVRIGEAASVPEVTLTGGEHYLRIYKYGRALKTTYEVLRRQRIDLVALHIARMAIQAEVDKVSVAMDVLINGDGNAGTAATVYNLTALDPAATPGTLTVKGWLAYKMRFANPYSLTTFLAQEGPVLQTQLLTMGSANVMLGTYGPGAGFGSFRPINPQLADTVAYGITADAPANKLVGFDRRFALERVFEIGSNIQETERYIRDQTQILVMTEVEGYGIFDPAATKILNLAA